MFGYVVINKPELKIKDYDRYHEYYCGLCKTLKKEYGIRSQLSLNNDLNFVNILLSGLYEPKEKIEKHCCALHPLTKHIERTSPFSTYASDMTIVLTYYKCDDDVLDDQSQTQKAYRFLLKKNFNKVKEKYPQKIKAIETSLNQIHQFEKEKITDLDKIANCFGEVMGQIFVYQDDIFRDDLYRLGFYLGKFIYFIDAYEDIEEDIKKNHYNPFYSLYKQDNFDDDCYSILEMMISDSCLYFEKLPIIENREILRNILYSGIWTKYDLIKNKRMEGHHESL